MKLLRPFWGSILVFTLITLASGCASLSQKDEMTDEQTRAAVRIMAEVQRKYAPDPHLGIFKIKPEPQGDYLILKGEVDNPDAKKDLVNAFNQIGVKAVDRISVLPSDKLGANVWGIVRISVANVREDTKPSAELGTQVLMGQVIRLWKQEGGWFYAQSSDRYLGWIEDDGFVPCSKEQVNAWNSSERLIITAYEDRIWANPPDEDTFPVSDVVMGGLVKKTGEEGDWFKVELPDGRTGYLAKKSAMDFEKWRASRQPSADNIIRTAMSFTGFPYLWGGTSSKGMDCSGFTKTVYQMNGVQLMRNASHQSYQGTDVPIDSNLKNLKRGDLLFFGRKGNNGPDRVTHVGIYVGNKMFIHSSGLVRLNSLDPKSPLVDERRMKSLIKVRRYLAE